MQVVYLLCISMDRSMNIIQIITTQCTLSWKVFNRRKVLTFYYPCFDTCSYRGLPSWWRKTGDVRRSTSSPAAVVGHLTIWVHYPTYSFLQMHPAPLHTYGDLEISVCRRMLSFPLAYAWIYRTVWGRVYRRRHPAAWDTETSLVAKHGWTCLYGSSSTCSWIIVTLIAWLGMK